MHTRDGFITSWVCVLMLTAAISVVSYSLYKLRKSLTKQKIVQMAVFAAVIFALQMLNFPIAKGTSGHFIGAGIATILFGPMAAILILSSVLLVQTFAYGDGGVFTIGVNVVNMGIIASYVTYLVYKQLKKRPLLAAAIASWSGIMAASIATAIELWVSKSVGLIEGLYSLVSIYAVIGVIEGLIAVFIIACVTKFPSPFTSRSAVKAALFPILIAAFSLAAFLPYSSPYPDGLDSMAINLGFYEKAITLYPYALMPNYLSEANNPLFVLIAGLVGMALAFITNLAITALIVRYHGRHTI